MPHRRVLLPLLVAALLLVLGPAQALAAPTWLDAEPQSATEPFDSGPDVATDAVGNSVAVWLDNGQVRAAFRPRGGPWGPSEDLDPGAELESAPPRVTVQPDGQFVAVWITARLVSEDDYPLRWARRPAGQGWSGPATITGIGCCPGIAALEATADGSVTVVRTDEGTPTSHTKPPGSNTWSSGESVPTGSGGVYAFGPDGSAVAVNQTCNFPGPYCMTASYRPPGGPWGAEELIAAVPAGDLVTSYEVTAAGGGYTAVWAEADDNGEGTALAPSRVRTADRPAGATRGLPAPWLGQRTVGTVPNEVVEAVDVATGPDGAQVAVWQDERMTAAVRGGVGAGWGPAEDIDAVGSSSAQPFATITTTGVPAVAWGSDGAGSAFAHAAHRDAAGAWSARTLGPGSEGTVTLRDIAADGDGSALTGFRAATGGIFTAGFDAGGPRFSAFSLPTGTIGQPLPFSAAADDNWSGPATPIEWLFGDGGSAVGSPVSHAYAAVGTYTASAASADQLGNRTVASGPVPVTPVAPPPPPPGCGTADSDRDGIGNACDDNNGAARPRPFRTVNATVVSGEVFVKLPAGSASASQAQPPKGFVRLEGAETIPVGATLDTARGRVKIRSAATTGRKLQTGQFFRGRFVIRQVRRKRRSRSLITDLRLSGSSFRRTCRTTTASVSQRRRSKRRVRRLFGNAKGSFRTSGRNAAATVRGTRWGVQDRCDGTLVAVQQGRVEVRDKVKRKTIILRAGRTYVAKRR